MVKRAVVCGAGGFIGGHLVTRLKKEGYWVRGVDIKRHEFKKTDADEFVVADLRDPVRVDTVIDGFSIVKYFPAEILPTTESMINLEKFGK